MLAILMKRIVSQLEDPIQFQPLLIVVSDPLFQVQLSGILQRWGRTRQGAAACQDAESARLDRITAECSPVSGS